MTVNLVMANADIRRMRGEGFREFRFVPLTAGLPDPWAESGLLEQYRTLVAARVFYPGLHGYTHFSPQGMLRGWHDSGALGERTRALLMEDIPYLASLTPEFNFALLDRSDEGEVFADFERQKIWVQQGIKLFQEAFGHLPVTTCAPGYRCNDATFKAWTEHGIGVVQTTGCAGIYELGRLLVIERNVFFEPLLDDDGVVERALNRIQKVLAAGLIPVICSHSINYVSRYCGGREQSLRCLTRLLRAITTEYPEVRFAHDEDVLAAHRRGDKDWFRKPRMDEMVRRRQLAAHLSTGNSE